MNYKELEARLKEAAKTAKAEADAYLKENHGELVQDIKETVEEIKTELGAYLNETPSPVVDVELEELIKNPQDYFRKNVSTTGFADLTEIELVLSKGLITIPVVNLPKGFSPVFHNRISTLKERNRYMLHMEPKKQSPGFRIAEDKPGVAIGDMADISRMRRQALRVEVTGRLLKDEEGYYLSFTQSTPKTA